jgi:hypothetical protein
VAEDICVAKGKNFVSRPSRTWIRRWNPALRIRSRHGETESGDDSSNMIPISIDLTSGQIIIETFPVNRTVTIRQFLDAYGASSNRIYGSKGNAKYCLAQKVSLFDHIFLVCFLFKDGKLRLVEFLLADDESAASPMSEDGKAKEEFGVLHQLLEKEFGSGGTSRRALFCFWPFSWGEISLAYQIQDLSVYVGITWT